VFIKIIKLLNHSKAFNSP